jgi:integrase
MSQGSIRKRGDRYYVRTRVRAIDPDTGKAKWKDVEKAAGRERRDALAMLKELQHQVDERRYVPNATTVLELGQRWLREHAQRNLKPSTAANYKGTFYTHVAPVLGSYRVDEQAIPEQVRRLLERKHDEALAPETIAKIHRHLHAMFAFAVEERILATNPVEALGRRRKGKVKHKTRGTALTLVEVRRFLEACSPRWRLFFRVALSTGLRRGEMIGLRWGDVSLSERVLQVRRSICPYDDLEDDASLSTKTAAGERVVPLFADALQALEELFRSAARGGSPPGEDAPVFATVEPKPATGSRRASVPGETLSPRLVTKAFRRYADRATLPAHLTLHDLRHTTITRLIEQGADPLLVATIAGHSRPSVTLDTYSHLQRHHAREAAVRFDPAGASHSFPTGRPVTMSGDVMPVADGDPETPANPGVEDA